MGTDPPTDNTLDGNAAEEDGTFREAETSGDLKSGDAGDRDASAKTAFFQLRQEGEPQRLDVFLCEHLPGRTRAFIQRLIDEGHVTVSTARRETRSSLKIRRGAEVTVVIPPPRPVDLTPQDIPIGILFEDENFAVINKPAGLTVHPAPNETSHTLVNALLYHLDSLSGIGGEERPGIVHRLDKETSGVLLVAKNDFAHNGLACQFKERQVHKTYLAIARGKPLAWEGRMDLNIGRSFNQPKQQMTRPDGSGRTAVTDFRVLETYDDFALIELYPLTGRTHQIRVHLAEQKLPIACDKLYGREKRLFLSDLEKRARKGGEEPILERHALHAASICFRHPLTRDEMIFSAPPPADFQALRQALERHRSFR